MQHFIKKNQTIVSMIAVMLAILLAALDQTIVATALPKIVQDFGELSHISWVATAYMLTSTITTPIFGKMSDIYGRKYFFIGGIIVFLIGSILCGFSQNMLQLIIFRGIQGIGSGAIFVNAFALVGDLFPPAERGKWQGIIGSVFGLASVVGPLTGGWLTDNFTWRWVFFVNIPVGIIALLVTFIALPRIMHEVKDKTIDWWGAALLTIGLTALLFGFVWAGNEFAWLSWQIIGLFLAAVVFLGGFVYIELKEEKAHESILPLSLFKNKSFAVGIPLTFLTGLGLFGAILYIPLFAQDVVHYSATNSGLVLTPLMLGWVITSAIVGHIVARTGKYKDLSIFGMEIVTLGFFLMSIMNPSTTSFDLVRNMILTGIGMGITFPILILAIQNAFEQQKLGVVTANIQLFRSLGGTIGAAVMGSILNNSLNAHLKNIGQDPFVTTAKQTGFGKAVNQLDANHIQGILNPQAKAQIAQALSHAPAAMQQMILIQFNSFVTTLENALSKSITEVFILSTLIVGIGVILNFFLPELPLRKTKHEEPAQEAGQELEQELGQDSTYEEPQKPKVEVFELPRQ